MTVTSALWRGSASFALTIAACGQPFFNPRPQPPSVLSDRPMDPGESLARGIVQAVLDSSQRTVLFDSLVAPKHLPTLHASAKSSRPDTARTRIVRAEWDEAFSALQHAPARGPVDSTLAQHFDVTSSRDRLSVAISPIGYSNDSLCAIVYYEYQEGRYPRGALIFLAHNFGKKWTVVRNVLLWVT